MSNLKQGKRIYFASDLHLGAPYITNPREHEVRIVSWLESIRDSAEAIYLVGDIFDFWYEYKYSIPKGFTRFLGKLSELTDSGIEIHIFTGNHDVWLFGYLTSECGVTIHHDPLPIDINGKHFYIAHGDELGNFDRSYKLMKRLFRNRTAQWLFAMLHPDIAIGFAKRWSVKSRAKNERSHKSEYWGDDKEWQVLFAKSYHKENPEMNFFIFGHRHIAKEIPLDRNCKIIYLGDWIKNFSYAEFDGEELNLSFFER